MTASGGVAVEPSGTLLVCRVDLLERGYPVLLGILEELLVSFLVENPSARSKSSAEPQQRVHPLGSTVARAADDLIDACDDSQNHSEHSGRRLEYPCQTRDGGGWVQGSNKATTLGFALQHANIFQNECIGRG